MNNPNIEVTTINGRNRYVTKSTEDLHLPSMVLECLEYAELVVSIAKATKVTNGHINNLDSDVQYTFRVLKLDSAFNY